MKINGLIKKARWEDIPCCCIKGDVEHSHPIGECKHCKFKECFDSMPKKDFQITRQIFDEEGLPTGKTEIKTITQITIVRGHKFQDIIGWFF